MAEKIITEFIAETGQFTASIDAAETAVIGLDNAEKSATKSTATLNQQLGSSAAKARTHRTAMAEVGKQAQAAASGTERLAKSVKSAGDSTPALGKLRGEMDKVKTSATSAGNAAGSIGGKVKDAASQAVPAVGGIAGSFLNLLGPVGLAIGAIGGAFLSIFRNTDAGATAIEGFGITAGQVFDRITGVAKSWAQSLSDAFGSVKNSSVGQFIDIEKAGARLFSVLAPIPALLGRVFGAEIRSGQEIANQLDELADKQLDVNEEAARNEIIIRRNLSALRDTTKPLEERLRLADEITKTEQRSLEIQRAQLKEEYRIATLQAARQAALKGEIDDDLKARLSGIRTQIFGLEADSVSLTERVASRRAGLVEDEEQRKRAAAEKTKASREKAAAEELRDAEKAAAAEKKREADFIAAEEKIAAIKEAARVAGLDEVGKRDASIRASYAAQVKAAREAFAELSNLATTEGDAEKIDNRQREVELELEQAMSAELERLRAEDLQGVRDFAKSEEQVRIDAVNKQFDLQEEQTKRLIASEEERTEILKAIEKNRQAALAGIRTEADAQRLAQQQATQDAELNAIGAFAQASSALLAGMAQGQEDAARNFSKAALAIAFDSINAMVPIWVAQATGASLAQPDSVATFGASGLARAAVLTALIKGVLAGLRSTLGFAEGGEVTKGTGPKIRRSNGDNVLATLQDREIVLSRASRARAERVFGKGLWGELGVPGFGGSIDWSAALAKVAASNGPRDGGAAMLVPGRDDRRIIGALGGVGSLREQRRQTELLEELARTRGRNPRTRWA